MTDIAAFSLPADQARAEALLMMARRESGNCDMTLAEAEEWWSAECDRLGLESRWPSK
jgi:hypothetical protein